MFFRRNNKNVISLNITAIDQKVIARKNQILDADFIEKLLQEAQVNDRKVESILGSNIFQHFQLILEKWGVS